MEEPRLQEEMDGVCIASFMTTFLFFLFPLSHYTVSNNIQMQNIGGKSQEYLNYSTDILKWKIFRIYKLFLAYSVPEK